MRLATITEYGAATGDYHDLVADLSAAKASFPSFLVVTFGLADLIEISLPDGDSLKLPRLSGTHLFRRSFGVLWPEERDLPPNRAVELASAEELLRPNPTLPLFSVTYLKLSPIPTLCTPPSIEKAPLITELLSQLSSKDSHIWQCYRDTLNDTLNGESGGDQLELRVAILIGLDSVDLVVLSRASRLEQIAALALSLRLQKLGHYWSLPEVYGAAGRIKSLMSVPQDAAEILWKQSALFGSSATVVGLPINVQEGVITLEGPDENKLVSKNVSISTRLTYTPGGFYDALDLPFLEPAEIACHAQEEGRREFLLLFDRSDILHLNSGEMGLNLHDLRMGEVRRYLRWLVLGTDAQSSPTYVPRTIRTRTELAVLMRISSQPEAHHQGIPQDLYDLFHEQLRLARCHHLSTAPSAWIQRWKSATHTAGMLYPITAGVLSLIGTVLDYLEDDIEGFVELLPALSQLILLAERELPRRKGLIGKGNELISEVLKLSGMLQGLATSRGRRDHPFRFPRETLAFEGHAGNRAPRAAFVAFVESLAEALDPNSLILVLESPGGSVSCSVGLDFNVVRVSPLVFFHPIHWVFAHEVAHGSFRHVTKRDLEADTPLEKCLKKDESISALFNKLKNTLSSGSRWSQDFTAAAGRLVEEIPADLMLWDSLDVGSSDSAETNRLFWFIHGPGLIFSLRHAWGAERLEKDHIGPLILRVFTLRQLLVKSPYQEIDGYAMLCDLFILLGTLRAEMPDGPKDKWPIPAQRTDKPTCSTLDILRCLREDLDLSPQEWRMAVEGLWQVARSLLHGPLIGEQRSEAKELRKTLQAWLEITVGVRKHLQPRRQAPKYSDTFATWQCYREYLKALIRIWPASYPWLPFRTVSEAGINIVEAPEVALDPRGGLVASDAKKDAEYRQLTFELLLRLDDLGREGRFRKLAEYLESAPA